MKLRISLLAATVLVLLALPTPASAARTKSCDGIGDTVTKLRSKGLDCDSARTVSAKWVDTAIPGGRGRVARIDGLRCVRSNPPGPGRAVRCAKRKGAVVVRFRYQLRQR